MRAVFACCVLLWLFHSVSCFCGGIRPTVDFEGDHPCALPVFRESRVRPRQQVRSTVH